MSIELEPLRIDHAAELVEVLCDERLYEHIGGSPPGEDELRARFARQVAGRSPDGRARWFNWVVREDGVAVGTLQATVAGDLAELAWVVGIPYRAAAWPPGREPRRWSCCEWRACGASSRTSRRRTRRRRQWRGGWE